MWRPVEVIRRKADAQSLSQGISKDNCALSLENGPSDYVIVDLDEAVSLIGKNDSKCDYLVATDTGERSFIAPVELTAGRKGASRVVKQLQAGARLAETLLPDGESVLRPVFAHGRRLHDAETKRFRHRDYWVTFCGRAEPIRLLRCGQSLTRFVK